MSDLHEARGPLREPQIDTVGWLFLVLAVAITAAAAMIAYKAHGTISCECPCVARSCALGIVLLQQLPAAWRCRLHPM